MTILLYNDGRLVIDDGNPIEGNSLEGLVACVSDPQSGDTLKFDGKHWVAGAAASGLPDVTGDDNGKVLTVVDGAWAPAAGGGGSDIFVVNIVFDSTSERNVLDKTFGEIINAVQSGALIISRQYTSYPTNRTCYTSASKVAWSIYNDTPEAFSMLVGTADMDMMQFVADTTTDYPWQVYD